MGQLKETYYDLAGKGKLLFVNGNNPQIKGVIQEVIYKDSKNLSPYNILNGLRSQMTKSTTGRGSDIVTLKGGRIVERIQVKDVTSSAGVNKLKNQLGNGKYHNSKIVASPETVEACKNVKITRKIHSSGISSKTTTRIADNTGVKIKGKNIVANNFSDIAGQAKSSALFGVGFGLLSSIDSNIKKYNNDEMDGGEFVAEVVKDGVVTGATAAAKTTAALSMKEGGKYVAAKVGAEGLKKFAGSNAGTAVAFGCVDQFCMTVKLANGEITDEEYAKGTCLNVGSTGGAFGGAAAGAAIGSAIPVVGTIVGGFIGALAGSQLGSGLVECLGSLFDWW